MSTLPFRTGIVYHEDYLMHEHSPTHPERRERLAYTMDQLEEEGIFDIPDIRLFSPRKAGKEELLLVHSEKYLDRLERMSRISSGTPIDRERETILQSGTYEQARLAAGGAITGGELVMEKKVDHAFVMARPGGHHAFRDRGHGFCFLNNTAVMIRYLQKKFGLRRILLWDWDAHHFDGTQSIFYEDPSVLTISIHQDGRTLFPGTGFPDEVGRGEGEGYNVNIPIPPGTSDEGYLLVIREILVPLSESYRPELMVIEAGQDNHFTDPITSLNLTAAGYAHMMNIAVDTAGKLCNDRLVAVLCGGYGIEGGLPYTNLAVIAALAGLDTSNIREPSNYDIPDRGKNIEAVREIIKTVKRIFQKYHKF